MAVGAPVALLLGLIAPGWWVVAGGWVALILGLTLADALIGPGRGDVTIEVDAPLAIGITGEGVMTASAAFAGRAPPGARFAFEVNDRLAVSPDRPVARAVGGVASASARLTPRRRGEGRILGLWLRWPGPLGLVWKQLRVAPARAVAVTPNIQAVKETALRLFSRDALFGLKTQLETGEGADFHALRDMVGAMDTRVIDWKQSARHGKLLGKEFRTERNHPIVMAIDTGRQMCEPRGGVPGVDLALNAALLLAYVCLKLGDRVGMYGFDDKPRLFTGLQDGPRGFDRLRRLSASLDYSTEETNYTLGLTQLGGVIKRRSLIVVFTDFVDTTTAERMIETLTRLARRHRVLFVAPRDEDLEAIQRRRPVTADDVTRAVTAAALLRDRELVIARLRRLGIQILDAPAARLGPALIAAYLDLKRRDLM